MSAAVSAACQAGAAELGKRQDAPWMHHGAGMRCSQPSAAVGDLLAGFEAEVAKQSEAR